MILTPENYHSKEAADLWMSASAVKKAKRCEFDFLHGVEEEKPEFIAGNIFELIASYGESALPEIEKRFPAAISSRGATKGQIKAEYQSAVENALRVRRQPFLCNLIDSCQKQVIMTGTILGQPVRMMCDLLAPDGSIYDLKCMKDFRHSWNEEQAAFVDWWESWYYHIQMWIYREIARQNGLNPKQVGLIAVSKSNLDLQAIAFSENVMAMAKSDTEYTIGRIVALREGAEPIKCGTCKTCIEKKQITAFEII